MSVLLIPIALTLNGFITAEGYGEIRSRLAVRAAALAFVAPAFMALAPFHVYLICLPLLAFLSMLFVGYWPVARLGTSPHHICPALQPES